MAKVLVTGGTGFVGSHCVAALIDAGHEVRLFVRSVERIAPALEPFGETVDDVAVGDVTDAGSLADAVAGCDAVIHAANIFSFHPRTHNRMLQVNSDGTRNVLAAATEAGLNPVIHVSSTLALLPSEGPLTSESPVGMPKPAYSRSKAAAERVARDFQNNGAPVVIANPGSVWGPHDPHLGESSQLAMSALRGRLRVSNDGIIPMVDVRDVARCLSGLVNPKFAGKRFLLVGHNPTFHDLLERIGQLTGRRLRPIKSPAGAALALGRAFDWISSTSGLRMPIGYEPPWVLANGAVAESDEIEAAIDIKWRSLDDSLADTIRWLHQRGEVTDKQIGTFAV